MAGKPLEDAEPEPVKSGQDVNLPMRCWRKGCQSAEARQGDTVRRYSRPSINRSELTGHSRRMVSAAVCV